MLMMRRNRRDSLMPAKNEPKTAIDWDAVVVPEHDYDLAELPLANKKRVTRMAAISPLDHADVYDAMMVLLMSPKTVAWLQENDPKALEQAKRAMEYATPKLPNPFEVGEAILVRDPEKPQYGKIESIDENGRLYIRLGDGLVTIFTPWDYRIAPD